MLYVLYSTCTDVYHWPIGFCRNKRAEMRESSKDSRGSLPEVNRTCTALVRAPTGQRFEQEKR
jgi:hypothetical protein